MAAPLITRTRLVAVKQEGTSGTAETLNAATGVMNCYDPQFTPELPMADRPSEGTYDAPRPSIQTSRGGRVGFRFDCIGGNTVPYWFENVGVPCGFSYNASSKTLTSNGSENDTTSTAGVFQDGMLKNIVGAMGNLTMPFTTGEPFIAEVEFMGKYAAPTDTTIVSPTYETTLPQRVASSTLTLGGYSPDISTGRIVVENSLKLREDITDSTGFAYCVITQQRITMEIDPEALLVASRDAYGLLLDGTTATATLTIGSGANVLTITIPGMQHVEVEDGDRDGILTHPITLLHTGTSAMTIVSSGS